VAALVHEDDLRGVDAGEVGSARGDDGVEAPARPLDDLRSPLPRPFGLGRVRLHDYDLPAGELEELRVDAREAQLEHPAGPVSQQLEDPRRRGGGQGGWKTVHRYARYMTTKRTGKYLLTPKAYGWGYDVNLYEVARRLRFRH
jgi:hypothetical protein